MDVLLVLRNSARRILLAFSGDEINNESETKHAAEPNTALRVRTTCWYSNIYVQMVDVCFFLTVGQRLQHAGEAYLPHYMLFVVDFSFSNVITGCFY